MERDGRKRMKVLEIVDRYKYVLLVVALGAALLAWPQGEKAVTEGTDRGSGVDLAEERDLEAELEKILGKIQGVGRVEVLLTLHSGRELVLAENSTLRYSGSVNAPDDYDRSSQPVLVSGGGGESVVVKQQRCPQYRGALVVCDGGGSDRVRLEVMESVAALTGLGSDRIAVVKRQPETGAEERTAG